MVFHVLVLLLCVSADQGRNRQSRKANLQWTVARHPKRSATRTWKAVARSLLENNDEHKTAYEVFEETGAREDLCYFELFHVALLTGYLEFYRPFANFIPLGMFFQEVVQDSLTLHFSNETSQFSPTREDEFFLVHDNDDIYEENLESEPNDNNDAKCVDFYREMQTLHTFNYDAENDQNNQNRYFYSRFPARIMARRQIETNEEYLKRLEVAAMTRVPIYPRNFSLYGLEDPEDFSLRLDAATVAKAPIMPRSTWENRSEFISRLDACREVSVIIESRGLYESPEDFALRLQAARSSRAPIDVRDESETLEEFGLRLDATREAFVRIVAKSNRKYSNETTRQFTKRLDAARHARAGIWPRSFDEDDDLFELRLAAARVAPATISSFDRKLYDDDIEGFKYRVEAAKVAPAYILPKAPDPEERYEEEEEETDHQFRLRVDAARSANHIIARRTRNETDLQFEYRLEVAKEASHYVHARNWLESDHQFSERMRVARKANVEIFAYTGGGDDNYMLRLAASMHAKSFIIPRMFSLASPDSPEDDEDVEEFWYPETEEEYRKRIRVAEKSYALVWPKGIHENRKTFYKRLDAAPKTFYSIWPKGKFEHAEAFQKRLDASRNAHSMLYPFNGSGLNSPFIVENMLEFQERLKACDNMPRHPDEDLYKAFVSGSSQEDATWKIPVYIALLAFVVILGMFAFFVTRRFVRQGGASTRSKRILIEEPSLGIEMAESSAPVESW